MEDCVFCKSRDKKISAKFEYESDNVMAFPDINPVAQVHILVVPKEHIETFMDLASKNKSLVQEMINVTQELIKEKGVAGKYRVIFNGGSFQVVPHVHLHLLGGGALETNMIFRKEGDKH